MYTHTNASYKTFSPWYHQTLMPVTKEGFNNCLLNRVHALRDRDFLFRNLSKTQQDYRSLPAALF